MKQIRFSIFLILTILVSLLSIGYVVNFVLSNGNNRPALFYAWIGFLVAFILYKQHRKRLQPEVLKKKENIEEREFQEWHERKLREEQSQASDAS